MEPRNGVFVGVALEVELKLLDRPTGTRHEPAHRPTELAEHDREAVTTSNVAVLVIDAHGELGIVEGGQSAGRDDNPRS